MALADTLPQILQRKCQSLASGGITHEPTIPFRLHLVRRRPLRGDCKQFDYGKVKYQGLHSVSINLSHRITLELVIQGRTVWPINVGDHDKVC